MAEGPERAREQESESERRSLAAALPSDQVHHGHRRTCTLIITWTRAYGLFGVS